MVSYFLLLGDSVRKIQVQQDYQFRHVNQPVPVEWYLITVLLYYLMHMATVRR